MIEWQLDDVLDINGWDLKKTLAQFRKFIEEELIRYEKLSKEMEDDRKPDWDYLDQVFLWTLQQTKA